METLLNLAWLMLLLPAYAMWRRRGKSASSANVLLCLACLLLILFPVISVSDDLSLMRAEMEDASGLERQVSDAAGKHAGALRITPDAVYLLPAPPQTVESRVAESIVSALPMHPSYSISCNARPRSPPVFA